MKNKIKLLMVVGIAAVIGVASVTTNAQVLKPNFNAVAEYENKIKKSKKELLLYKAENKKKLDKLNAEVDPEQEVFVTITFNKPLTKAQVTKLANDYDLKIRSSIARVKGENGLRGTIISNVSTGDDFINEETTNLSMSQTNSEFKGFIEVVGTIPNKNLQELASLESFVFLVDPSADTNLVLNTNKRHMPGVFWLLEDNNMVTQ